MCLPAAIWGRNNIPTRECYPKTNFRCALALWQFPLWKKYFPLSKILDRAGQLTRRQLVQVLLGVSGRAVELLLATTGTRMQSGARYLRLTPRRIRNMKPCDCRKLYEVEAISCLLPTAHPVSVLPASYKPTVWCTALLVDVPHGPCWSACWSLGAASTHAATIVYYNVSTSCVGRIRFAFELHERARSLVLWVPMYLVYLCVGNMQHSEHQISRTLSCQSYCHEPWSFCLSLRLLLPLSLSSACLSLLSLQLPNAKPTNMVFLHRLCKRQASSFIFCLINSIITTCCTMVHAATV